MDLKKLARIQDSTDEHQHPGHYEDFVDEDTGEVVQQWVEDETPEEEEARLKAEQEKQDRIQKQREARFQKEMEIRQKYDAIDNEYYSLKEDLRQLREERKSLEIDQEDELGQLYSAGKEAEAEAKAQEYGEQFNKIDEQLEEMRAKFNEVRNKWISASSEKWKELNALDSVEIEDSKQLIQ